MYSPTNQIKEIGNARNNRISKAMQLQRVTIIDSQDRSSTEKFASRTKPPIMAHAWPLDDHEDQNDGRNEGNDTPFFCTPSTTTNGVCGELHLLPDSR
jgi:hypothetical protein